MSMKRSIMLSLMLLCSIGLISGCGTNEKPAAAVEQYPNKPITIIVPFSPGGGHDMMSRAMEKLAQKHLGQTFVIKNVPGASGTIGWNELTTSEPDGYTLGTVATSAMLQPLYKTTQYHYPSALEPLVQVMDMSVIVVVRAEQPWNDMKDLINYAKEHPGEIKFGHSGLGTGSHIAGEMINMKAGVNMPQVPFKGDSESLASLLGGHIQAIIAPPPIVKEYVKSGRLKVLGIASTKRINDPILSNVPTLQEQGIDVVFSFWYGLAVHKGMPKEIKAKLLAGLEKIVNDPEYVDNMKKMGMDVEYLGQQEFEEKWLSDYTRLGKIVKESGIAEKIAAQKN